MASIETAEQCQSKCEAGSGQGQESPMLPPRDSGSIHEIGELTFQIQKYGKIALIRDPKIKVTAFYVLLRKQNNAMTFLD